MHRIKMKSKSCKGRFALEKKNWKETMDKGVELNKVEKRESNTPKESNTLQGGTLRKSQEQSGNQKRLNGEIKTQVSITPASITEIQDLYSALQDLVRSSNTSSPVLQMNNPSPQDIIRRNSPRERNFDLRDEASSATPEYQSSSTSSPRSSRCGSAGDCSEGIEINKKHRRGFSLGELNPRKLVKSRDKVSKTSNRKISSDSGVRSNKKEEKLKRSPTNIDYVKDDKEKKEGIGNKKKGGWNIIGRIRSKSIVQLYEPDMNDFDNVSSVSSQNKNRRYSDELSNEKKYWTELNSTPPIRRSLDMESRVAENTELLVATLPIGSNKSSVENKVKTSTYKNPTEELNKLESWFEKAAAEALKTKSTDDLLVNDDADSLSKPRRKISSNQRQSAVNRGKSNNKRAIQLGSFTKSTPDLRAENEIMNNDVETSTPPPRREIKKLDSFTNNDIKRNSMKQMRNHISFDDPSKHFPKTPLFFLPTEIDNRDEIFKVDSGKNMINNIRTNNKKTSNADLEEINKLNAQKNLKYFNDDFFHDPKSLWKSTGNKPDNVRNSLTLETGMQTDDNANFYSVQPSNEFQKYYDDITKPSKDERTLWSRFKSPGNNSKEKKVQKVRKVHSAPRQIRQPRQ